MREIRRVEESLSRRLPEEALICLLHGDLPARVQEAALSPAPLGQRKVILSTSIAETSLTIDGVRVVVDSGLARSASFDPRRGMSGLVTIPVSRAVADQRRGRAGRQAPGVCYRLWTERENEQLAQFPVPEIRSSDLAHLALDLALWGAPMGESLAFLDPPPPAHLSRARGLLTRLGAISAEGQLTEHGRMMAGLPIHPRLSHMIITARKQGLAAAACELAALLEERDLAAASGKNDADLAGRLEAVRSGRTIAPGVRDRILAQQERLMAMAGTESEKSPAMRAGSTHQGLSSARRQSAGPESSGTARSAAPAHSAASSRQPDAERSAESACGLLLALAYPDRIARRRPERQGSYHLANGLIASLPAASPLAREEFLAIAEADAGAAEGKIYLAAPVSAAELEQFFADDIVVEEEVVWDGREKRVRARRRRKLGAVVLEEAPHESADVDVAGAMMEGIRRAGLHSLPWERDAERLCGRIQWARQNLAGLADLPDFSAENLLAGLENWLAPHLAGMWRLEQLQRLPLAAILAGRLTAQQRRDLERLAPSQIHVPSGSRIALEYPAEGAPVLAVKLQELFGLTETPRIGGGSVPVTIHLLSPAARPLAVTQDLRSFWQNTYPEIRKQLRARYPKHPWPEDPLTALPTRKTIRKS